MNVGQFALVLLALVSSGAALWRDRAARYQKFTFLLCSFHEPRYYQSTWSPPVILPPSCQTQVDGPNSIQLLTDTVFAEAEAVAQSSMVQPSMSPPNQQPLSCTNSCSQLETQTIFYSSIKPFIPKQFRHRPAAVQPPLGQRVEAKYMLHTV